LELTSAGLGAVDTTRESVSFLIKGHKIEHVVLIAHEACGYYKHRFPYESPEALVRRQLADLRGAGRWVRDQHGAIEVNAFYARPADRGIEFEPVG
jgi:hypothetical protein